jgi:hypothetical protein
MIKSKNILAENMLRFGAKNLSESNLETLSSLSEQLKIKIKKGKRRHLGFSVGQSGSEMIDPQEWEQAIKTPQSEWDSFLEQNESLMTTKMSSTSKQHWDELKADPEHKGYAVVALERFIATNPKYKWQYVFCDSEAGIRNEFKNIPKLSGQTNAPDDFNGINMPIEFPINGPSSTFFEDNKWSPTADFEARLNQEVIQPLMEIAAEMKYNPKDTEPKFFLKAIDIKTSCSRFRNSGDAANMTFAQLSKARNDAALKFIKSKLQAVGILVDGDTVITQNSSGGNGDGSSGPNPPKPATIPGNGRETSIVKDETKRDDFGSVIQNKTAYDKFKYCIAGLEIIANTNWKNTPAPDTDKSNDEPDFETVTIPIPTKNYGISFYSKSKFIGFNFRLPKLQIFWRKRSRTQQGGGKWGGTNCPKWN